MGELAVDASHEDGHRSLRICRRADSRPTTLCQYPDRERENIGVRNDARRNRPGRVRLPANAKVAERCFVRGTGFTPAAWADVAWRRWSNASTVEVLLVDARPLMRREARWPLPSDRRTTVTSVPSRSTDTTAPVWTLVLDRSDGLTCTYRLSDLADTDIRSVGIRVVGCVLPGGEDVLELRNGSTTLTIALDASGADHLPPEITVAWMDVDGRAHSWRSELPTATRAPARRDDAGPWPSRTTITALGLS